MKLPNVEPDRLYTLAEAAALLPSRQGKKVHTKSLYRWHHKGRLPLVRSGRSLWVLGSDLEAMYARTPLPAGADLPPAPPPRTISATVAELKAKYGLTVGGSHA